MFCKYCNADLKPSDKICPVCEKPINDLGENVDTDDNATINLDEIDPALFAPLESSDAVVESEIPEQNSIDEEISTDEVNELDIDNSVSKTLEVPELDNSQNNIVEEIRESKNPMTFIPFLILIFAALIFGFGFIILRSPKMIFNTLINKGYKQINANILTDVDNMKGQFTLETNILTEGEPLNNIYIGAEYEVDYENETFLTKINTKYGNEKLLDADIYAKNNNGYILLTDVYDKYLSTKINGLEEIFEKAEIDDDHKVLISEIKNAFMKSLKSEYFIQEKANVIINDKNTSLTKNSLVLTEKLINTIEEDIIIYLKENNKFITSLSDVSEMSKSEILNKMEEILTSLGSETESNNTKITISIYTKGLMNEVVKIDVEMEETNEKSVVEVIKNSKDTYSIKMIGAETTINGNIELLDDERVELSLTELASGTTIGITFSHLVEYNKPLTRVDISNNIPIESLTEEDYNTIMSKLMENKGIQNLMSAAN